MRVRLVRAGLAVAAFTLLSACGPLPILLGVGVAAALGVSGGGGHHGGESTSSPTPEPEPAPAPEPTPLPQPQPEPAPVSSTAIPLNANGVARFLYVANAQSGTIAQYQIDATTGAITCLNVVFIAPGQQPSVIAVNPDQTLLFALTQTTISSFTIDAKAGGLTPIEATGPTLGAAPWWLAVDPSGTCLVETDSADDTVTSFTVGATGTLTQGTQVQLATGNGTANCAITTNAGTEYVAVCGQTLGTLNVLTLEPGTGALALLSGSEITTSATTEATIVQFDPTGVYGVVATQDIVNTPPTSSSIVAYTFAAGVLTQVGSPIALGAGAFPWDVEFDSKSANVFVVCDEPQGTASAPTAPNAGMVFNFTNAAGTLAPNATTPSTTVGYLPMQLALTDDTFGYTADAASSDIAVLADNAGALSSVGAPTPITTLSGGSPQVPLSLVTVR